MDSPTASRNNSIRLMISISFRQSYVYGKRIGSPRAADVCAVASVPPSRDIPRRKKAVQAHRTRTTLCPSTGMPYLKRYRAGWWNRCAVFSFVSLLQARQKGYSALSVGVAAVRPLRLRGYTAACSLNAGHYSIFPADCQVIFRRRGVPPMAPAPPALAVPGGAGGNPQGCPRLLIVSPRFPFPYRS